MQAWKDFLCELEREIGRDAIERWLMSLSIKHFDAGNLFLEAEDSFQLSWFEEHIRPRLKKGLRNNNFNPIKVHLSLKGAEPKNGQQANAPMSSGKVPFLFSKDKIDAVMSLDNFVVDKTNELTFSLLCSLTYETTETPSLALGQFNPIFLHGASGTGKTHLLMGLCKRLEKQKKSVIYVKADTFTENVVNAIRSSNMQEFRKSYRNAEVLIVDDVQIFSKKSATQEEFFHTFNTLHTSGRQIILTANCAPSQLVEIEPRLVSRFEWGLTLKLEKLEDKELYQMLLQRSEQLDFPLSEEVLKFLLGVFSGNVKALHRALEALILRTHSSSLHHSEMLKVEDVNTLLCDLIEKEKLEVLSPQKIVQKVAGYYGIRQEDILGRSQAQDCTLPRQVAMFLCRNKIKMPFMQVGQFFARDHSTVISSVKNIQEKINAQDKELASALQRIQRELELES